MKKNKSGKLPVKLISFVAGIFFILACFIAYGLAFFLKSDYFSVKNIISREGNAEELSYLLGKNIFGIDLDYEAARIVQLYPDCSKVRLVRLLPDRMFVDFLKRKPVAIVRLYRNFAIDQEGVFFYVDGSPEELGLPLIAGLETKISGVKAGRKYNAKELAVALNIIMETKLNAILKNYKIGKIDVAMLNNVTIFFPFSSNASGVMDNGSLEVKLGSDNIKDKIIALAGLIIASKNDLTNLKYIDLRFKEAVIKFRDVE